MKLVTSILISCLSFSALADNIIANGTRFIYPADQKEITVQLTSKANRPALVQAWLDNGDPKETPDTITTPFLISPPISRVDAKGGQTLRIKLNNPVNMLKDRESLWWLNVLEIPPADKKAKAEGTNILQLALRSRFKFIYRPSGLGNRNEAPKQLVFIPKANRLVIKNPSPFYITLSKISRGDSKPLNKHSLMIAPLSESIMEMHSPVVRGEKINVENINDFGATIAMEMVVN